MALATATRMATSCCAAAPAVSICYPRSSSVSVCTSLARSSSSGGRCPTVHRQPQQQLLNHSSFATSSCRITAPAPTPGTGLRVAQSSAVVVASAGFGPGSTGALTPELKEALDKFVAQHKVVLFMKGTKMFPQCGFSNTCVQILNALEAPYEAVNILEDEQLRQAMKEYSAWPTFPQLYIDGEFFGGCDITIEAFQKGELKEVIEKALVS